MARGGEGEREGRQLLLLGTAATCPFVCVLRGKENTPTVPILLWSQHRRGNVSRRMAMMATSATASSETR